MPDIKISGLPAATAAARTDEYEANQSGTSRKVAGSLLAMLVPAGFRTGLSLKRESGTSLSVTTGAAEIQGLGRAIEVTATITKTGISLASSTWYHVYLYLNAGSPDIEIVTTAPAAAYAGSASSKTGDTSRRYIGSVLTDGSGNIRDFDQDESTIRWAGAVSNSPFRVLTNGTNTSWTTVSLAGIVPVTARSVSAFIQVVGGTIGTDIASGAAGTRFTYTINPGQFASGMYAFDTANQAFYYKAPASGAGGLYIDVNGFTFAR